jgi:hypothetical protein
VGEGIESKSGNSGDGSFASVTARKRPLEPARTVERTSHLALAWNAPVRERGWDHVTHTVISAAIGAGKILRLDREPLRSAIGIAGTAHTALRVTRTAPTDSRRARCPQR